MTTPSTGEDTRELEPMERLRVLAALGGEITLDADTIRLILASRSLSKKHRNEARDLLERAGKVNKSSFGYLAASVVILTVALALIWWPS